jgi:hypothetical protein
MAKKRRAVRTLERLRPASSITADQWKVILASLDGVDKAVARAEVERIIANARNDKILPDRQYATLSTLSRQLVKAASKIKSDPEAPFDLGEIDKLIGRVASAVEYYRILSKDYHTKRHSERHRRRAQHPTARTRFFFAVCQLWHELKGQQPPKSRNGPFVRFFCSLVGAVIEDGPGAENVKKLAEDYRDQLYPIVHRLAPVALAGQGDLTVDTQVIRKTDLTLKYPI